MQQLKHAYGPVGQLIFMERDARRVSPSRFSHLTLHSLLISRRCSLSGVLPQDVGLESNLELVIKLQVCPPHHLAIMMAIMRACTFASLSFLLLISRDVAGSLSDSGGVSVRRCCSRTMKRSSSSAELRSLTRSSQANAAYTCCSLHKRSTCLTLVHWMISDNTI